MLYESLRKTRAEKVVQGSRERGNNKVAPNFVARWLRDQTLPFFLKHFANADALDWLYSYKVDWDKAVA